MPARGYEFYLRVFNTSLRVEHKEIKFVSTTGHVIFCLFEMLWCSFPIGWDWSSHDNCDFFTIVSSLDTKFSSLEKSWYFIGVCIINAFMTCCDLISTVMMVKGLSSKWFNEIGHPSFMGVRLVQWLIPISDNFHQEGALFIQIDIHGLLWLSLSVMVGCWSVWNMHKLISIKVKHL